MVEFDVEEVVVENADSQASQEGSVETEPNSVSPAPAAEMVTVEESIT
jgi:hypothetical protein